jgi:septal ring factor EnvC (AmiA/AmiB activator)
MHWLPRLSLALAACWIAAPSAHAGPSDQLEELRGRIERLQRQLAESEGSRTEAADALRASERAISDANRRLFHLTERSRDGKAVMARLQTQRARAEESAQTQQALLARLVYQQYLSGQPEPLRLLLNRQDPDEMARQMYYLGYVTRARADLLATLRRDLSDIERLSREVQDKTTELGRLRIEQSAEKRQLERERESRAKLYERVSSQIEYQRKEIGTLKRNEERLARLVERLARELARTPPRETGRVRNDQLPDATANSAASFRELKGRLKLPVIGELANRYGSPRADSGLSWKGLFIAAKDGQEVRSVAPGRVVFADWLRGFGNLIILDHGGGYMSLYGNNDSLYREVGDEVKAGDPIAAVGATGGNSQTGLYFELRFQGKPFDPLSWVTLK